MTPSKAEQAWRGLIVRRRDELIGGEIEQLGTPPAGNFRGPITGIEVEGGKLIVTTEWTGQNPMDHTGKFLGWRNANRDDVFVYEFRTVDGYGDETEPPAEMVGGRILFGIAFGTIAVNIIPKDKLTSRTRLYRNKVRGL